MVAVSTTSEAYPPVIALVEMSSSIETLKAWVYEAPLAPFTSFKISYAIVSTCKSYSIRISAPST